MDQHNIRLFGFKHRFDAFQNVDSDIKQRLLIFHNGKVIVRRDMKSFQYLVKHLPVLTGHTDLCIQLCTRFQFVDKRTHFYRFGTRPEYKHDLLHVSIVPFPYIIVIYYYESV